MTIEKDDGKWRLQQKTAKLCDWRRYYYSIGVRVTVKRGVRPRAHTIISTTAGRS